VISYIIVEGVGVSNIYHPGEPSVVQVKMGSDPLPVWMLMSMVLLVVGIAILLSWPAECLVVPLLSILVLLYTRLKDVDVLDNYNRGMINGYVLAHPGTSFSELRRSLAMPNGSLVYHLRILEKNELIKSKRAGNLVQYYGAEINYSELDNLKLNLFQLQILNLIVGLGTVSKSDLKASFNTSHQTLHYNLKKLLTYGVLQRSFHNGRWRYSLAPRITDEMIREHLSRRFDSTSPPLAGML
jgi:predicted transcriptional regulator